MTDNEIIKALECHKERELETCSNCPLLNIDGCAYELSQYALDLINRQKAEIERLNKQNLSIVEHLKKARKQLKTAKAEAIKEFAERLKEVFTRYGATDDCCKVIDNLVKEMVGDGE